MAYEHLDYRRDRPGPQTATEAQLYAEERAERRQRYLAMMADRGPIPFKPKTRAPYERPALCLGANIWNKPDATRALVPADAIEATRAEERRRLAERIAAVQPLAKARRQLRRRLRRVQV